VGQSGTGKTTIADLLLNIYHPEQGEVLIDKVSTVHYAKKQIGPRFAIVSQEPALFNRSIYENIRYNMNYSLNDVQEAARVADAYSFIEEGNFGSGYSSKGLDNENWDKLVGSKGSLLSGGQKQRVALARALIRKPVLMIMDEATSALDKETEERVLENIYKLNCTQVVIAHRLSTIKSCDRIIVLKEGKLVESGTYEELVSIEGEFARLAKSKREK
jgi:ABC-type multidrug transport system fused ATPase/permease subunit